MARLKVKQISDFTTAVQTLIDDDVDQNATSITSLADAEDDAIASVGSLATGEDDAIASIGSLATGEDDAIASIGSIEAALDGFAKEAYVHLAVTGLVSGSGNTDPVLGTDGSNGGDNVTEASGVFTFDLAIPMEAVNAVEGEAGLVDLQINGLGVDHSAVRWNNANSFSIIEAQLGYVLEASDRVEFKYIKD